MNCPNCLAQLDQTQRFCSFCGSFNAQSHTTAEDVQKIWQAAQRAYQRGDHSNGVTLLEQIINFAPATLEAYYYLADCYTNLGQLDQAVATMRQAQTLWPGSSTISFNLGVLEKRSGRSFEARQQVQEALRLLETDPLINNREQLREQMQKQLDEM